MKISGLNLTLPALVLAIATCTVASSAQTAASPGPASGLASQATPYIPANQDLYCADDGQNWVLKVSKDAFTNHVGDGLITQSGFDNPAALFMVHWNAATTNFVIMKIPMPGNYVGGFEHVTFAPIDIPPTLP